LFEASSSVTCLVSGKNIATPRGRPLGIPFVRQVGLVPHENDDDVIPSF
jgi:hypothetical protein